MKESIKIIRTAWVATGVPATCTFEVDADDTPALVQHLNPGRLGYVELHFDDEHHTILAIDGKHDPLRSFGFGPLGHITRNDGTKVLVKQPNAALPTIAVGYYRVEAFTPEEAATFKPIEIDESINFNL